MNITLDVPEHNMSYFIKVANMIGASNLRAVSETLPEYGPASEKPSVSHHDDGGVLGKRLFEVGISCYTRNRLSLVGIFTVADLVKCSRAKITSIGHIGPKSVKEIELFMKSNGLHFEMDC